MGFVDAAHGLINALKELLEKSDHVAGCPETGNLTGTSCPCGHLTARHRGLTAAAALTASLDHETGNAV